MIAINAPQEYPFDAYLARRAAQFATMPLADVEQWAKSAESIINAGRDGSRRMREVAAVARRVILDRKVIAGCYELTLDAMNIAVAAQSGVDVTAAPARFDAKRRWVDGSTSQVTAEDENFANQERAAESDWRNQQGAA